MANTFGQSQIFQSTIGETCNKSGMLIDLTLSWRRPLSYRNQPIDLRSKSMDWFLYDNGLRHKRVKSHNHTNLFVWLWLDIHSDVNYQLMETMILIKTYSHFTFRFRACFEQGVSWHSGNCRVWIHSQTRTWHDKNIQLKTYLLWLFVLIIVCNFLSKLLVQRLSLNRSSHPEV